MAAKGGKKGKSMMEALGVVAPETIQSGGTGRVYTKFAEDKDGNKLFIDLSFEIRVEKGATITTMMTVRSAKTSGSFKNFGSRGPFAEGYEYGQKWDIRLPQMTGKYSLLAVLKEHEVVEKVHAWLAASAAVSGAKTTFTEEQLMDQMLSFLDSGQMADAPFVVPDVLTGEGKVSKSISSGYKSAGEGGFVDHDDEEEEEEEEEPEEDEGEEGED